MSFITALCPGYAISYENVLGRGKNTKADDADGVVFPHKSARAASPQPDQELDQWRRERLIEVGLPWALAEAVGRDRRYDVHALLLLVDRGCDPELAVRILAPLDDESRQRTDQC